MKMLKRYAPAALVGLPFILLMSIFLIWPSLTSIGKAFIHDGELSLFNMTRAMSGTYRDSFILTGKLSLITSIIGGGIGLLMAIMLRSAPAQSRSRTLADSWSAVASQLGGLPLAFAFIALLGTQGILTKVLSTIGIDLVESGFSLTGLSGWALVYLYFQIPLMFLIMTPAVTSLRTTWFESATSMGASAWQFWRSVGIPILLPTIITGFVLLFVNSFSAYATAYALSVGAGQLIPLQIRFILQGNVITGEDELGFAIVTWALILLMLSLVAITLLQRRVSKWTEQ